ncbi:hypothetical protein [Paenibacillus sp. IHBB 3054]|uniref:hypothetical protein n=1 Tax=Paenibacillus sp. IHBB 3054 TaxID=3425689 RepID=UPI003F67E7ED
MATIKPTLQIELDPRNPVPEICTVISAVVSYHPAVAEEAIIKGLMESLENRWSVLKKGADKDAKPVHGPSRAGADQ